VCSLVTASCACALSRSGGASRISGTATYGAALVDYGIQVFPALNTVLWACNSSRTIPETAVLIHSLVTCEFLGLLPAARH